MEFLKPRIMDNGTEYYLAHEVKLCIEQAAKQIEETHSAYKELNEIIRKQKRKRCIAMARACHLMLAVLFCPSKEYFRKWAERGNKWIDLADKFKR